MNDDDCYPKTIDECVSGIRGMAIANKISPRDLFEIWSAGVSCAHILAPQRLGKALRMTLAEMARSAAMPIPAVVAGQKIVDG